MQTRRHGQDAEDEPQPMSFAELAAMLDRTGGPVTGVGNVNVREWGGAFGAHIVDLEVDPETGKVTLCAIRRCRTWARPSTRPGRRPDPGRRRAGHRLGAL